MSLIGDRQLASDSDAVVVDEFKEGFQNPKPCLAIYCLSQGSLISYILDGKAIVN